MSPQIGCGEEEDITTNTTMTVMEKKRAYKRKDCGGDTSTVIIKKTKDCVDTNTSTVIDKKRKDCGGDNTNASTTIEIKKKRPYRRKKYLPHDLVVEQILTKLPVPTLLKSVLVSKLWYNSIHNDHKRFTYSHFLQSQKQPHVILSLLNVRAAKKTGQPQYGCHFFKLTTGFAFDHDKTVLKFEKFRGAALVGRSVCEMVGYCNGLPCMAAVGKYSTGYLISDPNRRDFLKIFHPVKIGKHFSKTRIICHGFGFDPSANEYKLVSIFRTRQKELNVVVFTLGTKSWRNVTATSMPISGHGGRPILKIRAPTGSGKSAIFCTTSSSSGSSGCLVWKIITTLGGAGSNDIQHDNSSDVSNEMEMLLSFNLLGEKFQFIQLPAKSTADDQQKHLLVDYSHLLEFKGSPCIARIEKISANGSDYPHRCRDDHQGCSSSICCCCCKIHLYLLKNSVKQVWVKEESFDVRLNSTPTWLLNGLGKYPCCFCFGSTNTPPTRILSFSDQMLLYWFNGGSLQVYNLRSEKRQLAMSVYPPRVNFIFQAKMKEPQHIYNSGDDDLCCSNMDYQLHCHEENFLSLQTFIPDGVEGVDAADFSDSDLKRCLAYMFIHRGSKVCYPIYN